LLVAGGQWTVSRRKPLTTDHRPLATVLAAIQLSNNKKGAATTGFFMKPV